AMVAASVRGTPLLATLPRQARALPERHLGLVLPSELDDVDALLDYLADELSFNEPAWAALRTTRIDPPPLAEPIAPLLNGVTIGIARDAAFAFLYPANLSTLTELGAKLVYFSPLADEPVPATADAVYLPGGYPELHAPALEAALRWKASIREAHAKGLPMLAECGGMMALTDTLIDLDGKTWQMAGILSGTAAMQKRLAGLGSQGLQTPAGVLRGHTFHYASLTTVDVPIAHTVKHPSGDAGEAVYRVGSLTASFFHAYFASCPAAVAALFLRSPP
ncbi:MAG: cobyrinate a,c-diamide synthase, partial [Telluria sp.]